MTLYYEYLYGKQTSFDVMKQRHQQFVTFSLYHELTTLKEYITKNKDDLNIMLLDESRFDMFQFDCLREGQKAFTIHDLNTIIKEKHHFIKRTYRPASKPLYHYIDTMYVDGQETDHLIGTQGTVLWKLHFVYLKQSTINTLSSLPYSLDNQDQAFRLYPQSYFTIQYLKQTLQKYRFISLRITDSHAKLIEIVQGCYHRIEQEYLGISVLKDIYKENNILPLLYKQESDEQNAYGKELINECTSTYATLIVNRIQEHVGTHIDCVLQLPSALPIAVSDHIHQHYQDRIGGYMIPCHIPTHLKTFGHQRKAEHIDILMMLNQV